MTGIEITLFVILLVICFAAQIGVNAAYHNGVADGYGFAQEPLNPGYMRAGLYIVKHMPHRLVERQECECHTIDRRPS